VLNSAAGLPEAGTHTELPLHAMRQHSRVALRPLVSLLQELARPAGSSLSTDDQEPALGVLLRENAGAAREPIACPRTLACRPQQPPRCEPADSSVSRIATAERTRLSLYRVRRHVSSGSPLEPTIGFSRAVRDDRLVFVSATAAIWADGHVDPDVGVQARRCLEIIDEALRESGATLRDVVRTRVFLVDAAHGDAVAQVHGEAFGRIRPATGFIVVQGFLDPRWLVEIEADAIVGG
jgi:enamine deaminase RidA (YjgF/YER057c/UK114 family)